MTAPRKFRVWDGENMHEPPHDFYLSSHGNLTIPDHIRPRPAILNDGYEVMQYTGLTDAEGSEIWEGDVISLEYLRGVVEWGRGEFVICHTEYELSYFIANGVVVGNRYENAELLDTADA